MGTIKMTIQHGTKGRESADLPNGEVSVTYWLTEWDAVQWCKAMYPGAKRGEYGVMRLPVSAGNTTVCLTEV